ncbi:MAG: glycosyltransferase family 2 protein [Lentisphaerae bacterium]|nr:glycosyltransferase family 2 protein [Lentisphaerota bacterium]
MPESTPKVYIVLLNWNSWGHTLECLESILRSDHRNYQVIVVDNGSTDQSVESIIAWTQAKISVWTTPDNSLRQYSHPPFAQVVPCLHYNLEQAAKGGDPKMETEAYAQLPQGLTHPLIEIETSRNLGFGRGNNVALEYICAKGDGDFIWLLNNDTVIEPTTLSRMLATARLQPGIIGSIVKHYAPPEQVQAYGGGHISVFSGRNRLETSQVVRLDYITGASLMLDAATLHFLGGFDENIFMYFEDVEYCLRARKHGISLTTSDAVVFHKGGISSPDGYFPWKNVYQSKIYTMLKHYGIGPWVLGVIVAWAINLVNPRVSADKKRASREALHSLCRSISKAWGEAKC